MSPDPITVVHESEKGRVFTADSMTYFDERTGADDIVICGSYTAPSSFAWAMRLGVKGIIAHAVGVGKDNAGISGLPLADEHGVPAAACETMSARIADGGSVWAGTVGHVNETAKKPVQALVMIGDALEEDIDKLCGKAGELGVLGVPLFMFQEGSEPQVRNGFQQMARLSKGAYATFDEASAQQLADLMTAVATFASGGTEALKSLQSTAAQHLLQQLP